MGMQNFKKGYAKLLQKVCELCFGSVWPCGRYEYLLGSSIMFHYSTLVCVHSFGRKDGGPYYPQGPFCHKYTLAGAHIQKQVYSQFIFCIFPGG